jgi:uncharacterized BrkB/YihY/UPF0761 family membrane protein
MNNARSQQEALMNIPAIFSALIGFVVVFGSIVLYFRTIPRGTGPKNVGGFAAKLAFVVAPSAIGLYLGVAGESKAGLLVYIPSNQATD